MSKQKADKRNIFAELMQGVDAMREHREGKVALRTSKLPASPRIQTKQNDVRPSRSGSR